jgi:hypothetical protein
MDVFDAWGEIVPFGARRVRNPTLMVLYVIETPKGVAGCFIEPL